MPFFIFVILITTSMGCKTDTEKIDVSHIKADVSLIRFDKMFFESDTVTFPKLKSEFPEFFPFDHSDLWWLEYKNTEQFKSLYNESQKVFGNFDKEKKEFEQLFRHIKYFYPSFKEPKVLTLIAMNLEDQMFYSDSILIVALDNYLGVTNKYYSDIPEYSKYKYNSDRIHIDAAMQIAEKTVPDIHPTVFIERLTALGKLYFAVQSFLPNTSENKILGYSQEKWQWSQNNEYHIWQYMMEKEYVYSSDKDLERRFIDAAPFSKFYIESDNESPGRIGIWLGLQIVKSYMENNAVSLPQLMATSPLEIFNKSKYKPSK